MKNYIYLLLQFNWRPLLLAELTIPACFGLLTKSWIVYFLWIIAVFLYAVYLQKNRTDKGLL